MVQEERNIKEENSGDGWKEWRKYVLNTLDKLEKRVEDVEESVINNRINISNLLTKSKIYGSIAGFIVSGVISLIVGLTIFFVSSNIDMQSIKDINSNNKEQIEKNISQSKREDK